MNKTYKVIWKDQAERGLAQIDKKIAQKIFHRVEIYLTQDPINIGKPLRYDYQGFYRYRCFWWLTSYLRSKANGINNLGDWSRTS